MLFGPSFRNQGFFSIRLKHIKRKEQHCARKLDKYSDVRQDVCSAKLWLQINVSIHCSAFGEFSHGRKQCASALGLGLGFKWVIET
jgi:hypothetical protein